MAAVADGDKGTEDIQVYNRDDPGVTGVEQIKSTVQDQTEVDILGYRRGVKEAEEKLSAFMERVSMDKSPKPKRFLLGSITKDLPTRITVLVPMETYSLDEIHKNTNLTNKKKKIQLGPPMFNFAEQKMKISRELLPEITNLVDEETTGTKEEVDKRKSEEEKERIRSFYKRITHEDDFIQNVFDFEENYLGWISKDEHYRESTKKQRIVRSSMKILFQFIFSDASINDANRFYQDITIGYTKLFPKEKLPCNTDIRKDFQKCLEWRRQRLQADIQVFEESLETDKNITLEKMKAFEKELKDFLEFMMNGGEKWCMVYGDNLSMTIKQSPVALKQKLAKGISDEQAEMLLRLLRNVIEESEETRKTVYSYDEMIKMMKNMSKIPMDDEDREKDGPAVHEEILDSLKMLISSNAEEQMKDLTEHIQILQGILQLVVELIKAKHAAGITPAEFLKKEPNFPSSSPGSPPGPGPTDTQIKEVKQVLETLSKQEGSLKTIAQSLLPIFTGLEMGTPINIQESLQKAVQTYEDILGEMKEIIGNLTSEGGEKQQIAELEAQRKELEGIVNAVKTWFEIDSTNPSEILTIFQTRSQELDELIQEKDTELVYLQRQIAEKEEQIQQASTNSIEKQTLHTEIARLGQQLSAAEQQRIQLSLEKGQLETQNQLKDSTIQNLQGQIETLQTTITARQKEIATLRQEIDDARAEVQAKDAAFALAKAEAQAAAEAAAKAAADAVTSSDANSASAAALQAAQQAAETALAVAKGEKDAIEAQLQSLQGRLLEQEAAKEECDEQLAALQAEKQSLTQQLTESKAEKQAAEGQLAESQAQLEAHIQALTTQLQSLQQVQPELAATKAEKEALETQLASLASSKGASNAEKEKLKEEVDKLKQELEDRKTTQSFSESKRSELEGAIAVAEGRLRGFQSTIDKVFEEKRKLASEKESLEKEKQGQIDELTRQLKEAQDKLQKIESEKVTKTYSLAPPTVTYSASTSRPLSTGAKAEIISGPSSSGSTKINSLGGTGSLSAALQGFKPVISEEQKLANRLESVYKGGGITYDQLSETEQNILNNFHKTTIMPKITTFINNYIDPRTNQINKQNFSNLFFPQEKNNTEWYKTYGYFNHTQNEFTNSFTNTIYTSLIWNSPSREMNINAIHASFKVFKEQLNTKLLEYIQKTKGTSAIVAAPLAGGALEALPKQEICEGLLALFLQRMDNIAEAFQEKDDEEFTLQAFMDHAGATMDELGQCPFVLDLLMRLLQVMPQQKKTKNSNEKKGLTFHKTTLDKKTQYQLEELEKAYSKYFSNKEQKVLTKFSPPLTLYSQTPEAYRDLLGETPYVIEENDMDLEDDEIPLHGLEDEIVLTEDEQKELENTGEGGIPLGALMFLYVTCLKEILAKEEHPTLNSKCPLLTPQRTVHRAKTPKRNNERQQKKTHRKKSRGKH